MTNIIKKYLLVSIDISIDSIIEIFNDELVCAFIERIIHFNNIFEITYAFHVMYYNVKFEKRLKCFRFVRRFTNRNFKNVFFNRSIFSKIVRKYFKFSFVCELYMINLMNFIMIRKQNNIANVRFIKHDVNIKTNCRVIILCSLFVHWMIALNRVKNFNFEKNDIFRNRSFIWNFHFLLLFVVCVFWI